MPANKPCCFCKKIVLGIYGQDDVLDTYNLLNEAADKQAVTDEVYGSCHMTCLLASTWNDFWVTRRLGNYVNTRGYERIYQGQDGQVFREHRTGQNVVLLAPGVILPLDDRSIKSGLRAAENAIEVRSRHFWELPLSCQGAEVQDLFDADGSMPLLKLAGYFDVADKFRDPEQSAKSRLQVIEEKTAQELRERILFANVLCAVTLPTRLLEHLVAVVPLRPLPEIPQVD